MKRSLLVSLAFPFAVELGCGPAPAPAEPSPPPAAPSAAIAPPPPARSAAVDAGAAEAPEPEPVVESVTVLDFRRELQVPVRSIGIGRPRIAVLSDQPWIERQDEWQELPLPERLRPAANQQQQVRIFFGRDDRPRIMGWRSKASGGGLEAVYLRHQRDGWHAEKREIGRLSGNPPGALFGVLGHDDPEVVCKVDDICIIKRRTGWNTIDAGPGRPHVELCGADAWALHPDHLARVTDAGWERVGGEPPWRRPSGFWAISPDDIWVAVADGDRLFHFDGEAWTEHPSPVPGPGPLWAAAADSVWLVGAGGAAHWNGSEWRRHPGLDGPLTCVRGAGADDVYVGGPDGLWHGGPS